MGRSPDRVYHRKARPHRKLFRTAEGADVARLQRALNARLEHIPDHLRHGAFENPRRRLNVDGVFGQLTFEAYKIVREAVGLPHGHPPTRGAQAAIRWPWTRSPAAKRRARRRRQPRTAKPRIITAAQIGLRFQWVFGATGWLTKFGWHYSAGARARDAAELIAKARSFHAYHGSLGWGGLSYPFLVADDGTLLLGNPVDRKSAQVANENTGMAGCCCPGTTGDRLTPRAQATVAWLEASAHTRQMPKAWRLSRPAGQLDARGHKEFPGQSTACPGDMLPDYRKAWNR